MRWKELELTKTREIDSRHTLKPIWSNRCSRLHSFPYGHVLNVDTTASSASRVLRGVQQDHPTGAAHFTMTTMNSAKPTEGEMREDHCVDHLIQTPGMTVGNQPKRARSTRPPPPLLNSASIPTSSTGTPSTSNLSRCRSMAPGTSRGEMIPLWLTTRCHGTVSSCRNLRARPTCREFLGRPINLAM
jgi:hypothetical protein